MFKKQAIAEQPTQPAGTIADLRAEVQRLAAGLAPKPGSIMAQYEALDNRRSELEQINRDLSQPFDQASNRESEIAAIKRRLLALEPLRRVELPAHMQAHAEYQAAATALRDAEIRLAVWRANLAASDRETRVIMAFRDFHRSQIQAEINRLAGGSTAVLPHPATYEIT